MNITFTQSRLYGGGIGLRTAGETIDTDDETAAQFIAQGLAVKTTTTGSKKMVIENPTDKLVKE